MSALVPQGVFHLEEKGSLEYKPEAITPPDGCLPMAPCDSGTLDCLLDSNMEANNSNSPLLLLRIL